MKPVILVGFMGCGKSTVGKKLSQKLEFEFVDSDSKIEENEGVTISEIFATKGEEYFRNLETMFLEEMLREKKENVVLSTGGGMPVRPENSALMKNIGSVVYLRAKPETVYERVKHDTVLWMWMEKRLKPS